MLETDTTCTYETPLLQVYEKNILNLTRFAVRLTGCYSYAEDIVQETFFRLPSTPKATSSPKAQLSYIFQIVRNLSIDHHRKQTLINKTFVFKEADVAIDKSSPEVIHNDSQALSQLDVALAQLPARTRYVFEQHRIYGVAQKDIALELGVSKTLVNFMVRDALSHCCKSMG
ncbi:MAG: sigma-70 family RNA polymerase sigma factor [Gammaproteobacteria bacterium]|nr:sigma-70 family RNA polymerase sigma factor [Gammaproteobacteria bacterium]